MLISEFEENIKIAYRGRKRDLIEALGMLQCEVSELSELFLKAKWYNKYFSLNDVKSEVGDILNFLTFVANSYGVSLEEAMEDNIKKLKDRKWIEEC